MAAITAPTRAKTERCTRCRSGADWCRALPAAASSAVCAVDVRRRATTASLSSARSKRGSTSRPARRQPGARRGRFSTWTGRAATISAARTCGQGGGDSLQPRLRYAYGTLGGFLAGQAISNFSDADADTESMEFGGAMGSTGGQRIPQVRYTLAGPYGSAFSVSAENPWTDRDDPGRPRVERLGICRQRHTTTPRQPAVTGPTICNGVACTGTSGATSSPHHGRQSGRGQNSDPDGRLLLVAALGARRLRRRRPRSTTFETGATSTSSSWATAAISRATCIPAGGATTRTTSCSALSPAMRSAIMPAAASAPCFRWRPTLPSPPPAHTPTPTSVPASIAASNIIVQAGFRFSTNGGYQHWWTPTLRSTIAAGMPQQDVSSQLIGPTPDRRG